MHAEIEYAPGLKLHYSIDDYTDPWRTPETVLMVHGLAESTEAWRAWVPHLARDYRVARMDVRGFGRSTPLPEDHPWSMDLLLADIGRVIDHLGGGPVHLVGAKSGGSLVMQFAARWPEKVRSLVGVTPPVVAAAGVKPWIAQIETEGVVPWARATMAGRLGSKVSAAEVEWWIKHLTGKTARSTLLGYLRWVPGLDIREEVLKIRCASLIITTTGSGLRTVDSVKAWQEQLPRSELVVIDGDAWHAAAAYPDRCAEDALRFLRTAARK